jgi:hypothetical protein
MASGETLVLFLSLYKMQALLPTEEGPAFRENPPEGGTQLDHIGFFLATPICSFPCRD